MKPLRTTPRSSTFEDISHPEETEPRLKPLRFDRHGLAAANENDRNAFFANPYLVAEAAWQKWLALDHYRVPDPERVASLREHLMTRLIEERSHHASETTADDEAEKDDLMAKEDILLPTLEDAEELEESSTVLHSHDMSLKAFNLTLILACRLRHETKDEPRWYIAQDRALLQPMQALSPQSLSEDAQRTLVHFIRQAAIQTLSTPHLYHHIMTVLETLEEQGEESWPSLALQQKVLSHYADEVLQRIGNHDINEIPNTVEDLKNAAERMLAMDDDTWT